MNELSQAIYLQVIYVFTNVFLARFSKSEIVRELNVSDGIVREFHRVMNKRHPNNPWLYYGTRY